MKAALLFSSGKDSCLAMQKAKEHGIEVICLISIISENKESYMFHTPNIELTKLQAQAMNISYIEKKTEGQKEKELNELKEAIQEAIQKHNIQAVITGAVGSTYQSTRIQSICHELDIFCFDPLWQKDQIEILQELVQKQYQVIISGVFAYPLDESWLGKEIDQQTIEQLKQLQTKFKIHPAGEGGEIETLVLDGPMFKQKLLVKESYNEYDNHAGVCHIKNVEVQNK